MQGGCQGSEESIDLTEYNVHLTFGERDNLSIFYNTQTMFLLVLTCDTVLKLLLISDDIAPTPIIFYLVK